MKKITKTILTAAVIAGMLMGGGCGGSSSGSSSPKNNESALMQKIKSSGKLTVGTASGFPPYEFLDTSASDGKKIDGIDIKLAEAVAKKLGVKLEIQDMTFQSLLSSLTTGKVDKVDIAVSAINPTEERKKTVDFSDSYLEGKQTLLVRKEDAGKYKTLSDFDGKRIGVQKSTIQEKLANEQIKNAQIVALPKVADALLELKTGKVDAVPVQNIVGGQYLLTNSDLSATDIYFSNYSGGAAVAVPKESADVIKVINEVIAENKANGNIDKWVDEMTKKAVENAKK